MRKMLSREFFNRSVVQVAEELVGKCIVQKFRREEKAFLITETEAYDGEQDLACHASKGRTKRTEVLYGEPGHLYVYLCYGMHWMLNVVTDTQDYPAAVLIRGIEGAGACPTELRGSEVGRGPGRVTRMLGITGALHGKKADRKTGLWFEDRPAVASTSAKASADKKASTGKGIELEKLPRVGVAYAGPIWSKKLYRFRLKSCESVNL